MEENSELEEGEACYYKDDDDDNNIDPDIALSYIDEKIQNVLGHLQKDFEGGVSAENLGAKFGGYGSFLPTHECFPTIWSNPKTPQTSFSSPRSPHNLPVEGTSQSLKVPPNAPSSVRFGTSSSSASELQNSGVASGDVSVKRIGQKFTLKDENLNKSVMLDQRKLKVRIKVSYDNTSRKNAAIYSGLGLDNSPSTSLGNSPEEGDGMLPVSQKIAGESPTSILRVMTSFPVPGSVLVSPLHDSLLCLIRKERLSRDSKPMPSIKGGENHSALLLNESVSVVGNGQLLKEKGEKLLEKSERSVELKHETGIKFENETEYSANKKLDNKTSEEHAVREGLLSPDLVKEDSSESVSVQDCGKNQNKSDQSGLVEKVSEHRAVTCCKDAPVDVRGSGRCKANNTSGSSKAYSHASKCNEDLNVGSIASSKQKIGQQATFHVQDETVLPSRKEKPLVEGKKKSQGIGSSKKAAISTKESMRVSLSAESTVTVNGSYGVSASRDKHQLKPEKEMNKVKGNRRDSLDTKLEQINNQMPLLESPGDREKDSSIDELEKEQNASFDKSMERFIGKRVDNHPISETSIKDAAHEGPSDAEKTHAYEVVQPAVNPVVIQENWVMCDSCQRWRLLPYEYNPELLPEKWLCSMQTWLPGMNRCDISEDETTKAFNATYQQIYSNGVASGVTSVNVQNLEQNDQIVDSHASSFGVKKKHGFKEVPKEGSGRSLIQTLNPLHNQMQESVKSRSLNDMNKPPSELNLICKSSLQHLSKSNLVAEKHSSKQKENHVNRAGESKQVKKRNKRAADYGGHGITKKAKTIDMNDAGHQNFDLDTGKVGLNSRSGLATNVNGLNVQKSINYSFSKDMKCDVKEGLLVSVKNAGERAQVSLDGGSLDTKVKAGDNRDLSLKKRKLLEWQDNQNRLESNKHVEKSSESGLRKEKKSGVSRSVAKESSAKIIHDKLNKKGKVAQFILSGRKDRLADGMEAGRIMDKDERRRKHQKGSASQQALDDGDLMRKGVGSGHILMTATSSSSQVSGSLKTRTFDAVKGSPAESVSSSPLRTSIPGKVTSAGGDNCGLPVIGKVKRRWNGDVDDEVNRSGTARKEKVSDCSLPEPLSFFPLDDQVGGVDHKIAGKANASSNLLEVDAEIIEHRQCSSDLLTIKSSNDEDRVDKSNGDNVLFPQKPHNSSSVWSKDKDRNATSGVNSIKMKISNPVSEQVELSSKKSMRYESEIDPKSHAAFQEGMKIFKHGVSDKSGTKLRKDEKDYVLQSDPVGQCSKDSRMENELKLDEHDCSDAKLDAPCSRNGNATPKQNLNRDWGGETRADPVQKKSRTGTPELFSDFEGQGKQESQSHISVLGSQKGAAFDGLPVQTFGGDVSKALKNPGNSGVRNSACVPDMRGFRDLSAPSPGRTNSAGLTATNALKEAKNLRDYADRLKSSGFGFESNEAYFQAALKFLHGASLLETCISEGGKQGEMTQMQAYNTTAKLCKCCAIEYENRHEMAAAALAYKCMEVACWRVVYCKNSTSSKDQSELQASLQMIPQGESPSSSASDVDNLNNHATVEKATLSKCTVSHVAGTVIVARNHLNFLRLFDFTQDVNFAVEATRKSLNAFSAANVALEEARNRDCISSVRKVIDFSFQDVEGFIHLVQLAMKAVSHSGFDSARE